MASQNSRRRRVAAKQTGRSRGMPAAAAPSAEAAEAAEDPLRIALQVIDAARTALLQSQARLEAIKRDSTDDTEVAAAAVELINVERELKLLEARRNNLVGGTAILRPPGPEAIAEAQERAARLAQVLANNGKVAAIVGLVADIVRLTEKLVA